MPLTLEPLPPVQPIRINGVESLDPVQLIVQERNANEAHVIVECFGKCWAAYFRHGTPSIWKFLASLDADYLTGKLALLHEQKRNRDRNYLVRVAQAVIHGAQVKIHHEATASAVPATQS